MKSKKNLNAESKGPTHNAVGKGKRTDFPVRLYLRIRKKRNKPAKNNKIR